MSQALDVVVPVSRDDFPGYVQAEILRTTGPQPPWRQADEVLTAFWDRLGPDKARRACAAVFGPLGGIWRGAPVTPKRFAESQDEFFAIPVLAGEGAP